LSNWSNGYLVAGIRLEIVSSVGDPSPYLPSAIRDFTSPGPPGLTIEFREDEQAQTDPLRRFFPPQFAVVREGEGLSFEGIEGRRKRLGIIATGGGRGVLGLPDLRSSWRLAEEEKAVREAVQAFVRACLQCRLLEEGGTLMHGAGVVHEGCGYALTGHTRAGKTTLSRDFPVEAVLGDDLVAVRQKEGAFELFGTPWPGREGGTVAYGGVPLRAVLHLHPELEPGLYAQSAAEAVAELASNAPRMGYVDEESKLLVIFSSLVMAVPIYRLSVRLGDDVMPFLKQLALERGGGAYEDGP
jgi:hypothetical protein